MLRYTYIDCFALRWLHKGKPFMRHRPISTKLRNLTKPCSRISHYPFLSHRS